MIALPPSFLHQLEGINGFDKQAFIDAHQQHAVTSIRLHPVKKSTAFIGDEHVPWCKEGRYLKSRPVFTLDPLYHAGAYYVQEASSMFLQHVLEQILPTKENLRVLDLCAAPGGKSTLIASLLNKSSLLISNEVIRSRASVLEENMTRWGYMNTWVTSNDPAAFSRLEGYFDIVVVDAPCSGSGLFRKDKKALEEWSEGNVQLCSQRQQRILADVWPALKEDGMLVYATCSYSPQEDEHIMDWLAETFDVESISLHVPEKWGIVRTQSNINTINGYRFFPDKVKGEGFYIAAIRKKEVTSQVKYPKLKPAKMNMQKAMGDLFKTEGVCFVDAGDDQYAVIYKQHEADMYLLKDTLYIRKAGVHAGMPTTKDWLYAHDIALSIDAGDELPSVDVDKEQALRFLKKEEMRVPDMKMGWNIVKYNGLGIGWIKNIGNRINNYLPKQWRIRMEITDADWK